MKLSIRFVFTILIATHAMYSSASSWPKIKYTSDDGWLQAEVNGAIMGDYVNYENAPEKFKEGAEAQSLKLSLKLKIAKALKLKVKYDYSEDEPELKDLSLGYEINKAAEITIGQFEQPSSLDGVTSSNDITFMTRAAPVESFLPGRSQGINLALRGDWAALQLGSYIEYDLDDGDDSEDYVNYSFRTYFFPVNEKRNALHIGIWGLYADPVAKKYEFEVEPEAKVNAKDILESGKIKHINHVITGGLETGWIFGPLTLQAEYLNQRYSREEGYDEFDYSGHYISASYILTGESKSYKKSGGAIESPNPKRDYGALEVAFRVSNVDLTDENRDKGEFNSNTIGINWYLNQNFRMMYNYIQIDSTELDDKMGISQVRLQYDF